MVTIKDIAKQLGVSVSTVSRALNDHPDIRKETKKKVLEALDDHQYTPNALARSLSQKKSYTIGLLLPNITGHFYATIAQIIEDELTEFGYYTLYGNANGSKVKEKKFLTNMLERKVDGIIATPDFLDEESINLLKRIEVPIVFLRRRPPVELNVPFVDVHYYQGAIEAVQHLLSLGHSEIGFIGLPQSSFAGTERFKGYCDAIEQHGHKLQYVTALSKTLKAGNKAMGNLLDKHPHVTAVFAAHDLLGIGALEWLAYKGIKVPEQMSMIGFGNLDISDLYWTKMTTVAQPVKAIGEKVAEVLLGMLNEKKISETKLLMKTELIIRDSCAPLMEKKRE